MNFKLLLFLLYILISGFAGAQTNLVRNPSFEFDTIAPPIDQLNWHRYNYWMSDRASDAADPSKVLTQHWFQPTKGTSDYFNSYQSSHIGFATKNARTGKGRMGIIAGVCHYSFASWLIYQQGYSEYIETRLSQPLVGGKTYCVRYYVALDRKSNFATSRLGALFTRDSLLLPEYSTQIWQQQPQVVNDSNRYITADMGWVMICDTFIAAGGEEFLTIGNFDFYRPKHIHKVNKKLHGGIRWSPIDKSAYYYIDDVSVTEISEDAVPCTIERDTISRNNLLLIVDIAKGESNITAVQIAIHQLAQSINHNDLISIVVKTGNGGNVILENCPADSLARISAAISQITYSDFGKKDFTVIRGYDAFLKKYLIDGNNHAILITDSKVYYDKPNSRQIENASYYKGVKFSVIQLGELTTSNKMKKLAVDTKGDVSRADSQNLSEKLIQKAPLEQQDTKYSGRKNYTVASWIFLSKILPVLLVVILATTR
jgi:hypothetical protein